MEELADKLSDDVRKSVMRYQRESVMKRNAARTCQVEEAVVFRR